VLRLNTIMNEIGAPVERYDSLISEIVLPQVDHFRKMYLQENRIRNLIVVDDYLSPILHRMRKQHRAEDFIPGKELELYVSQYAQKPVMTVAQELQVPLENIPLLRIAAALVTSVANRIGVESIWAPGVTLCDGLVYEYAEQKKWMDEKHDFEQDIVACAVGISKRYMGNHKRSETLQALALAIFDTTKKLHGLSARHRLLLQICAILHDCGKYISLSNMGECSYHIIMSTEMIGLSHREREMVANIVRFNHTPFETILDAPERYTDLSEEEYLVIAKLSAILRVANGLDRTHKQKFKEVHFRIQQEKLVIAIDSAADITVEKGMFERRALFFEEVFGILPVIRQKKERGVAE
ncbi:MAG: HD domain-containing protein, partial [Lachnospiraceae bacterium]|nr:HD domain-containing protein [Lachnospiraceae bacterium]